MFAHSGRANTHVSLLATQQTIKNTSVLLAIGIQDS